MSEKFKVHGYDEEGRELCDPTPVAPPVGYRKQPSMVEMIRNMVKSEALRHAAEQGGAESFADADDFDIGDDFDPNSPYEDVFEPTPIAELKKRHAAELAAAEAARAPSGGAPPTEPAPTAPQGPQEAPAPTSKP